MDPPVAPQRVLPREADGDPGDAPHRRRPSGSAPRARVVLPCDQSAVPGQQRRGCHREDPGPPRRGMNGASAANQARSAGSYRTRPAVRRSTAFSCRSTKSSAPARATSASARKRSSRAPGQTTITAPGRLPITAGQPPGRVFGRHRIGDELREPQRTTGPREFDRARQLIDQAAELEEFLRQSGVSFGSRLSCLGEEPLGSDLGAVLLPQVGSVRVRCCRSHGGPHAHAGPTFVDDAKQ
jgi:hypothetical protein